MEEPDPKNAETDLLEGILRISIGGDDRGLSIQQNPIDENPLLAADEDDEDETTSSDTTDSEDIPPGPEFRLVRRDDPEAYTFNTPQYSAHKLPKDVVDASLNASADGEGGAGLREFMTQWRDIVARQEGEGEGDERPA